MSAANILALVIAGGSLLVSCWAAVTAHRARLWQQRRDAERRATRVHVEFMHSAGPTRAWPLMSVGGRSPPPPPRAYTLTLVVVNEGETVEYVTAAFIESAGGPTSSRRGIRVFGSEGHEDHESHELQPRARMTVPLELEAEQLAWAQDGVTAEVWLGSGPPIVSEVEHLMDDLLADLT